MAKFDWRMKTLSGTFEADDMKDALKQAVDVYFELPFPGYDYAVIEIICKKREAADEQGTEQRSTAKDDNATED